MISTQTHHHNLTFFSQTKTRTAFYANQNGTRGNSISGPPKQKPRAGFLI